MSYEELEQRMQALEEQVERRFHVLEEEVAQLKEPERLEGPSAGPNQQPVLTEDGLVDGCECDIVLNVPPEREYVVKARIVSWERGPEGLALSEAEWASLQLEDENE